VDGACQDNLAADGAPCSEETDCQSGVCAKGEYKEGSRSVCRPTGMGGAKYVDQLDWDVPLGSAQVEKNFCSGHAAGDPCGGTGHYVHQQNLFEWHLPVGNLRYSTSPKYMVGSYTGDDAYGAAFYVCNVSA